jgi:hypothetical protein
MLKPARGLAILLIAGTSNIVAAQSTQPDSIQARQRVRQSVRALLDSAETVRGTKSDERAFMWRVAKLLAEFPASTRGARIMQSVDDAASSLERLLMSFGMAMAVVHSTPPGSDASFRRIYDTTATSFNVTANDSLTVAPAKYFVVCKWPGKQPSEGQRKDCTIECRVECPPPQ